ncbi:MAG: AAA family ATPase [Coriobacteriales bacterium]|jgi:DNA polymerase III delta prime subunit|nr:AAA family ATPase [Coriobacteriales bacterium]
MKYSLPLWLKNIENALRYDSVFIIHGQEVKDAAVMPKARVTDYENVSICELEFMTFYDSIKQLLARKGFEALVRYDINNGFHIEQLSTELDLGALRQKLASLSKTNASDAQSIAFGTPLFAGTAELISGLISQLNLTQTSDAWRANANNDFANINYAVMIDCFSETNVSALASAHPYVEQAMLSTYQLAKTKALPQLRTINGTQIFAKNPVFWVVGDTAKLPHYLRVGNGIRQVSISAPDLNFRQLAIEVACYPYIPNYSTDESVQRSWKPLFAKAASALAGLSVNSIQEIVNNKLSTYDAQEPPDLTISDIIAAAREYRVGLTENPWASAVVANNISNAEELLKAKVKGQDYAVRKSADVLRMASLGINSFDSDSCATAPRGCMLFAGPTGVGKTELAKQIAKLVFGSEDDMIRFDMSEFSASHNAARLTGAPPGYTGNEQGGELTNKVKQKPFSLLLFDEIEKADGSIWDKFLQILSDGRLTDGRGETVYFSETIIVFTTNKCVVEMDEWQKQHGDADQEAYRNEFKSRLESFFRVDLKRPEVFGRIDEDNIIIFNAIDENVARSIAELGIAGIITNLKEQKRINLELKDEAKRELLNAAADCNVLRYGGRGVKNSLRKNLIKPLSALLMNGDCLPEGTITVSRIVFKDGEVQLST